jgi:hypothetical protein
MLALSAGWLAGWLLALMVKVISLHKPLSHVLPAMFAV